MKPFIDYNMLLSEHFKLSEFLASQTAEEKNIPNVPLKCHITALQNLVVRCLEPTRQHFGLPIQITSGYRCPKLNEAVKGAPTSQHMKGEEPSRVRKRRRSPYREDCNNSKDRENSNTASACVCLNDTQQTPAEASAPAHTDYRQYSVYMKR